MDNIVISNEDNTTQENQTSSLDNLLNAVTEQQKAPTNTDSALSLGKMPLEQTPAEQAAAEQATEEELKNSAMLRRQQGRAIRENATRYANAINSLDTLKGSENAKKEQEVYESSFPINARYGDDKDLDPNDPNYNLKITLNNIDRESNAFLNNIIRNSGYTAQQKLKDQLLKFDAKKANAEDVLEIKVRQHEKGERLVTGFVEDGDTANVVIDGVETRFRIINGAISFDATDDWGTHNKQYQIERIAERLGKDPSDVTEQDVADFKAWTNFVIVNAIKNNGFSKYEAFNPNRIGYYKKYVEENNHGLSYILRPVVDNKSNTLDVYGRPFAQILSADGKVNISDSLAMNSMFNLNKYKDSEETYFNLQPALRAMILNDYEGMRDAEGYIKARNFQNYMDNSPTPRAYSLLSGERWLDLGTKFLNSLPESVYQSWQGLKRIYYDATGDEKALERQIGWFADHQELNLFGRPNESYQLYRQWKNQEVIDTINKGGVENIVKGYLMGVFLSPVDALIDSLPEMLPLAFNGYLGAGVKALTGYRAAGFLTSFMATALTAGMQETNAVENQYYVRTGHAMPTGLWYTTLAGSTLALMIEIPAAMTFVGNPLALFNPKQFMTAKADTTLSGLLRKNSWEVFKGLINETITEPMQNAYFNTMALMNTTADLPNFYNYYVSQFQGSHFGERMLESATAAGMSGLMGGKTLITRTAIPLVGRELINTFGEPTNQQLGKTNPAGSTIEDIQLMQNNAQLKQISVDLQNQRDKINNLLDPNVPTDAQTFNDAIDALKQKINITSQATVKFSQSGTWSSPELELLERMIKQNNAFMINKALAYANTRGLDVNAVIKDLYNKENINATGQETLEEMRDWLEYQAALNVFGSIPKTIIETRLAAVRKALKEDPDNQHYKDMEAWYLDDYNADETMLHFGDGKELLVHTEAYKQFAETYRSFYPKASSKSVLEALQKNWTLASMNDDVMLNGIYHNSLREYTERIRQNLAELKQLKAAIQGQITNFNNLLPDDVEKLKEDFSDVQLLLMKDNKEAIEAFKNKYAPYATSTWNVNALIEGVRKYMEVQGGMQADFAGYNRFLEIRLKKTDGILDTIKNAVKNKTRNNVSFEYDTTTGTTSMTIVMGQFYAGSLLHPDSKHKSLELINRVFEETLAVARRYQELANDIEHEVPTLVQEFAQQDANEAVIRVQNAWNELVTLQQDIRKEGTLSTKEKEEKQDLEAVYDKARLDLYPILLGAAKKLKHPFLQELYQAMLDDENTDWITRAQQLTEAQINSDMVAGEDAFDFKNLYLSLDTTLRANVQGILKAAYNTLDQTKRTKNDLHTGTDAEKEALLKVAPYKDSKTNLIYNLILQVRAAETIEAKKGKQKKQPKSNANQQTNNKSQNKFNLTQEELNLWSNIEKWLISVKNENNLGNVKNYSTEPKTQRINVWFEDGQCIAFAYNSGNAILYGKKGENKSAKITSLHILDRTHPNYKPIQRLAEIFSQCFNKDTINNGVPNTKTQPATNDENITAIPENKRIPQGNTEYEILPEDKWIRTEVTNLNNVDLDPAKIGKGNGKATLIKRTTQSYEEYLTTTSKINSNNSRGMGIWDTYQDYDTIVLPDGSMMTRPGSDPYHWNGIDIRNFPKDRLSDLDAIPLMKGYSNNGSEYILCYNPKKKLSYARRVKFPDPASNGRDVGLEDWFALMIDPVSGGRNRLSVFLRNNYYGNDEISFRHWQLFGAFIDPKNYVLIHDGGNNKYVYLPAYTQDLMMDMSTGKVIKLNNLFDGDRFSSEVLEYKKNGYEFISEVIDRIFNLPDDAEIFNQLNDLRDALPDEYKYFKANFQTEYSQLFTLTENTGIALINCSQPGYKMTLTFHPSSGLHYLEKYVPEALNAIRQAQGLAPINSNQEAEITEETFTEESDIFTPTGEETQGVIVGNDNDAETAEEDVIATATDSKVIFSKMQKALITHKAFVNRSILLAHKEEILKLIEENDYSKYTEEQLYSAAMAFSYRMSQGMKVKSLVDWDTGLVNKEGKFKSIQNKNLIALFRKIEQRENEEPDDPKTDVYRRLKFYMRRLEQVYTKSPDTILRAGYAYGILLSAVINLETQEEYRNDSLFQDIKNCFIIGGNSKNGSSPKLGLFIGSHIVNIFIGPNDKITLHYDVDENDKKKGFFFNEDRKCYYYGDKPLYLRNADENTPFMTGAISSTTKFSDFHLVAPTSYTYNGETYPFNNAYYVADATIEYPATTEEAITEQDVEQETVEAPSVPQESTETQPETQAVSNEEVIEAAPEVEDNSYADDSFFANMNNIPESTVDLSNNITESSSEKKDRKYTNNFDLDAETTQCKVVDEISTDDDVETLEFNEKNAFALEAFLLQLLTKLQKESLKSFTNFSDKRNSFSLDSSILSICQYLADFQKLAKPGNEASKVIDMFRKGVFCLTDGVKTIQMKVPTLSSTLYKIGDTITHESSSDYTYVNSEGAEVFLRGEWKVINVTSLPLGDKKGMICVAPVDKSDGAAVVSNPEPIVDPAMPTVKKPKKEKDTFSKADELINTQASLFDKPTEKVPQEKPDETAEAEDGENPYTTEVATEEVVENQETSTNQTTSEPTQENKTTGIKALPDLKPYTDEERNKWKSGCYAGIGSRETPTKVLELFKKAASKFEEDGLILRSGGAKGADKAFENGVQDATHKEIFIAGDISRNTYGTAAKAIEVAQEVHPIGESLTEKKGLHLHARNGYQVLGTHFNKPVDFILCWTPPDGTATRKNGSKYHGTAQAIRIAEKLNIPVFNLYYTEDRDAFTTWYKDYIETKPENAQVESDINDNTVVEVSTAANSKSRALSALNLKLEVNGKQTTVEKAYQASKITTNPEDHEDWENQLVSKNTVLKNKGKAFIGNKLDVDLPYSRTIPQAYFILYLCGLKNYLRGTFEKNVDAEDRLRYLISLLGGRSKFNDSFEGRSFASQADVLTFLRDLATTPGNTPQNVIGSILAVDYHDDNTYNDLLQAFNNWFRKTNKYAAAKAEEDAEQQRQKKIQEATAYMKNPPDSQEDIAKEADLLFDNLYKETPAERESYFKSEPFLNTRVALAKSNQVNIRNVGWSTILTNFVGALKYTSPKLFAVLDGFAKNVDNYIMARMTAPVGTKRSHKNLPLISKLDKGYSISSITRAYSGTSNINTLAIAVDDSCAVKLSKDKTQNEIIIQGDTVRRVALLKAVNEACIGFLQPNSKGGVTTINDIVNRLLHETRLNEQDKTQGIPTKHNIKVTEDIADKLLESVEKIRDAKTAKEAQDIFINEVLPTLKLKTVYERVEKLIRQEADGKKSTNETVTKTKDDLEKELIEAQKYSNNDTSANQDLTHIALVQQSLAAYKKLKDTSAQLISDLLTHISVIVRTLNQDKAANRASKTKEYDELVAKYTEEFKVKAENTNSIKDLEDEEVDEDGAPVRDKYAEELDKLLTSEKYADTFIPSIEKPDGDGERIYAHKKASPLVVSMYKGACQLAALAANGIKGYNPDEHVNSKTFVPNHLSRILDGSDFEKLVASKLSSEQIQKIDNFIKNSDPFSMGNRWYSNDFVKAVMKVTGKTEENAKDYIASCNGNLKSMEAPIAAAVILEMMKGDPALALLYNFSVEEGTIKIKVNKQVAYAIYTEAVSGLANYSSLTNRPTDKACADSLGVDENTFQHDPNKEGYKKLLNKIGTPEYNASVTLGRNVAQRLNMKIRAKGETNVALGNRIETTFGKLALKMIQDLNNSQLNSVISGFNARDNYKGLRNMMFELCNAYQENLKNTPEDDESYGHEGNLIARAREQASIFTDLEYCFSDEQLHTNPYKNAEGVQKESKFNSIPLNELAWFVFDHIDYFANKYPKSTIVSTFKSLKEKGVKNLIRRSRITPLTMDILAMNELKIKSVNFVRMQGLDKTSATYTQCKTAYDALSSFFVNTDEELRGISHEPITKVATTVTNFAKTPIGATQRTALENLQTTAHHFDEEAMKIFQKYQTSLFYIEGGKDEDINKDLTEQERQSDKNVSLGRSFAILSTLYNSICTYEGTPDENLNTFYLQYAVMKNMRFNCKSILNPQMDKAARWLTYAGQAREFNIQDENAVKFEKWALANAFDMVSKDDKVDKCFNILMDIIKNNQLGEFEQDACTLSAGNFEDKWGLGMEDRFQVISAIAHLKRRAEAMKGDGKFYTTLRVEIDSTTSGYFLRFMTYLDANVINKFGSKVGLVTKINKQLGQIAYATDITDYSSMESYKKAINDIYREIAVEMSKDNKAALKETWEKVQAFGRNIYGDTKDDDVVDPVFASEDEFLAFIEAMPSATQEKNGAWDVSSDLRALLKKVVMVFGYSAGEATMEHNLSEAYVEEYGTQANDAIRTFRNRLLGKKTIPAKDYDDYFQAINTPDNKMMIQYMKVTSKFLKWFTVSRIRARECYLMNNGRRVPMKVSIAIANTLSQLPKGINPNSDLATFVMYERFFKLQNEGYTDPDTQDHYDIIPDDVIYNVDKIRGNPKKGKKDIQNARSVAYGVKQVFDRTAGEACIKAMKSFAHLSQDNMVLSTIGTMLNAEAKEHFTKAINEGLKKHYEVEEGDWVKRSEVIANDLTFSDYQTFLDDYKAAHPELDGIFSVIDTAFSLTDGDEYRLQVSDAEWQNVRPTSVNEQIMNHAFSIVAAPVDTNTSGLLSTSSNWYPSPQITTAGYVTRERQLIDIGLIPTASTVQALDAAVMAMFVNLCKQNHINLTSIHDAGVVSFLDTEKASTFYNLLAYLVCSKMCIKKQYITQALIQIKNNPKLRGHLEAILNNEKSPNSKLSLRRTHMLTELSYKNLNKLFGIESADSYFANGGQGAYYGSDEEGDGYIDTIATVDNYIKLLLNEVYEIDRNWDEFYAQADLYIRNMGGMSEGITSGGFKTFVGHIATQENEIRKPYEQKNPDGTITIIRSTNHNLTGINKLAGKETKEALDKKFKAVIDSMIKRNNGETLGSLDKDTLNVTSSWTEVLSAADSCNSAAIIGVLDRLPSSTKDDPRAIANFKNFLSQLDLRNLTGFRVEVAETDEITQGLTQPAQGVIQIAINSKDTSTVNPSPATVYMHEVLHAILNYAFEERKNNPQINRLIEKMRVLQDMASKVITPADLQGNDVGEGTEAIAQSIWNYVFNNKDDNDRGLKEFLSYAVTDKVFIEKLRKVKVPNTKVSIYTRIKQFLTTLWNLITLKSTISEEVAKRGMFTNNRLDEYAGQNVYNAMLNLIKDIQEANAKATTNVPTAERALYTFYKAVNTFRTLGNKYLVGFTRNLFTFAKLNNVNTLHPTAADVAKTLASLPFSSKARKLWYDIVSKTCTHYQVTDIRLLLDDFTTLDSQRERLDQFARNNRAAETYYQQVRGTVLDALQNAFKKELTQEEHKALTKAVLRTDLQCLYDGKNYDTVKKVLQDASYRTQILSKMRTEAFVIKTKNYDIDLSYPSQQSILKGIDEISNKWAYVLYYGKGDPLIGTGDDINSVGEKIEQAIMFQIKQQNPQISKEDKDTREWTAGVMKAIKNRLNIMTTIKAINILAQKEPNALKLVKKLSDKGIQTLIEEHQGFKNKVRETDSVLERMKEQGKGYLASQYNQAVSYKIVPLTEKDKMEYNGYTLVENLHDKKNLLLESGTGLVMKNNVPMGIFVKKDISVEKRMNSAFSFIASKWSSKDIYSYLADGVTLDQATSDQVVRLVDARIASGRIEEDQRDAVIARKTKSEIEKRYFKILGEYRSREIFKAFQTKHIKTPLQAEQDILNSAFDGDSYNPLTIQEKVEKLKQSENAFDIIAKQVATQTAFNRGKSQNAALIKLLKDFAKYNMNPVTHRDKHEHKNYVNITDRLLHELHLSKDLLCDDGVYTPGMAIPDIWVREDFVERLFGVKSVNLSQATIKRGPRAGYSKYPPFVRKSFEILERILKVLGYKEKETIVVRKPGVLIGNVMSNFSYNCLSEPNWWKVAAMQKANVENTNNYLQAHKRWIELDHKERIGKATDFDIAEKNRMVDRMRNNPIAPLFESNMFTNIVEDITLKDKEAVQDYFNKFADSKFVNKLPRALKVMFNQAYMRQGTPIFDAFYNINKYSDFIARATEYQIQMEKHKDEIAKNPAKKSIIEREVLNDVWNAFIDYDRPNGKWEQYLNDMGILMFTKYTKGIQRVIFKQLTTNPAGLLIHLAREAVVPFNIEDIYEANVFNKDWGLMFHNPFNNLVDVVVPPLPRLILGLL